MLGDQVRLNAEGSRIFKTLLLGVHLDIGDLVMLSLMNVLLRKLRTRDNLLELLPLDHL